MPAKERSRRGQSAVDGWLLFSSSDLCTLFINEWDTLVFIRLRFYLPRGQSVSQSVGGHPLLGRESPHRQRVGGGNLINSSDSSVMSSSPRPVAFRCIGSEASI